MTEESWERCRELVERAASIVVFSGAGISTESGIPDFRSPTGLWTRVDPMSLTFDRYVEDREVRRTSWRMRREFFASDPQPNAAHRAVAALERSGRSPGTITQNIDGLHQTAGSTRVVEVHGTARTVMCIGQHPRDGEPDGCGFGAPVQWAFDLIDAGDDDPWCPSCGGLVKSSTVSFGQALFPSVVREAEALARDADLLIAVGSSLQVYPAAGLPSITLAYGGQVAIVNAEPTPFDDEASVVVRGRAGDVLPAVLPR